MNKPILMIALLLAGIVLLAGCAGNTPTTPAAPSSAAAPTSAPSGPAPSGMMGGATPPTGMMNGTKPPMMGGVQTVTVDASNFKFTPGTDAPITVKVGVPVKLLITSTDVNHGISDPGLGIDANLPVGEQVEVDFTPTQVGTFPFRCSVFCGEGHRSMTGAIVVTG